MQKQTLFHYSQRLTKKDLLQHLATLLAPCDDKEEKIGTELEFFLARRESTTTYNGLLDSSYHKYCGVLLQHAKEQGWKILSEKTEEEYLITGYERPHDGRITFEPGKQLEIATACYDDFFSLKKNVLDTLEQIALPLQKDNLYLLKTASYPFLVPQEQSPPASRLLLPTARYKLLAEFYDETGEFGEKMMKHTAATQVCLDNGKNSREVAQRYCLGELLAPYTFAIFANSPFSNGRPNSLLCNRVLIIKNFDPTAAGFNHSFYKMLANNTTMDLEACIQCYAELILNSRILNSQRGFTYRNTRGTTFGGWMDKGLNGVFPTLEDLKFQMQYIFPEVRVKGFLELRSPDAQSSPWIFIPLLYYMGLLLCEDVRHKALDLLLPKASMASQHWDLATQGLQHKDMGPLCTQIMKLALEGIHNIDGKLGASIRRSGEIAVMEAFAHHYTFCHRTPAQDLLDLLEKTPYAQSGSSFLPIEFWNDFQQHQTEIARINPSL